MTDEISALDPAPEQVKLQSGMLVDLEALKARQFFKLLRILTHGTLPNMRDLSLFQADDPEAFAKRLLSLLVLSIPDAEDETVEFIRSLCKPVGLVDIRWANKQDQERNNQLWATFDSQLDNPELEDVVTILDAVFRREAEDMLALGKRLQAMFAIARKTGQLKPSGNQTSHRSTDRNSSGGSPGSTTSSPASTTGTTTTSVSFPSGGSVSVSQPSASVATSEPGSASNG